MKSRRRTLITKPENGHKKVYLFLTMLVGIAVFIIVILTSISSRAIKNSKYSVVYSTMSGDTQVTVYDFELGEITNIKVPPRTYISTAYELGDWRVESLVKLGRQEGFGGELSRMSLVKNFHFPIDAWVVGEPPSPGIFSPWRVITQQGSLTFGEKIALVTFLIRSSPQNIYNINLDETSYLKKVGLPDGTEGYLTTKDLPLQIGSLFSLPIDERVMVGIYDYTEKGNATVRNLSEVLHIMGSDWVVIDKETKDFDCSIRGQGDLSLRISRVFKCDLTNDNLEGNFDIEILIGEKFKERF